jgi:hypothetical protein
MSCKKSEGYTRTPLSTDTSAYFVRTPVDYGNQIPPMSKGKLAWQTNPHWMAFPGDEEQPLEYGPIDFYKDERKLANGSLFEEFGNNYVGGTGTPYVPNDEKTRSLLVEMGEMNPRRLLDSVAAAGWPRSNLPAAQTDLTFTTDSDPNQYPLYGGQNYFFRDQIGAR